MHAVSLGLLKFDHGRTTLPDSESSTGVASKGSMALPLFTPITTRFTTQELTHGIVHGMYLYRKDEFTIR